MHEVDGVKVYTASDPLDVLPTPCTFIVVMCENRNRKKPKPVLEIQKPNRLFKIQTDPALDKVSTNSSKNTFTSCHHHSPWPYG